MPTSDPPSPQHPPSATNSKPLPEAMFRLARPCSDCPFRKDGAIGLAPGRLDGIVQGLQDDDWSTFHCHQTAYSPTTGGAWDDEEGKYQSSGQEGMCAGAIIYLEKACQPTVGMRLGRLLGVYDPTKLLPYYDQVIEPLPEDEA